LTGVHNIAGKRVVRVRIRRVTFPVLNPCEGRKAENVNIIKAT
jgi:hypothetical protein